MLTRIFRRNVHSSLVNRYCKVSNTSDESGDNKTKKPSVKELLDESAAFVDTKPTTAEDKWATLPYVEGTVFTKTPKEHNMSRDKIDPSDTSIVLFPGQGSQFVGMAKNLVKYPAANDLFEIASEILGYDLLKLCLEGPESKLNKTIYCQPAVMVTSLAALEQLKEERPQAIENCTATAGFSLGEITSLVFAGALPFDRAVRLVQIRAEAMQAASDETKGGMATILFGPDAQLKYALKRAKEWCVERGVENPECQIANYLFPDCKVISGNEEALQYLEKNLKTFKLRKMKRIPVYGAFHSNLMASAVEPFEKALQTITIEQPIINVYSNVNGKKYFSPTHILRQLPKQIILPVKWEQIMHHLYARDESVKFPRTFICGPGNALRTILQKVNAKAWDSSYKIGD